MKEAGVQREEAQDRRTMENEGERSTENVENEGERRE